MTIYIVLKDDKEIYIHSSEQIEGIKEKIISVLSNKGNCIHFQNDIFDRDLIIMKDQIRTIEFFE